MLAIAGVEIAAGIDRDQEADADHGAGDQHRNGVDAEAENFDTAEIDDGVFNGDLAADRELIGKDQEAGGGQAGEDLAEAFGDRPRREGDECRSDGGK